MKISAAKHEQYKELEELIDDTFGQFQAIKTELTMENEESHLGATAVIQFTDYLGAHVFHMHFSLNDDKTKIAVGRGHYELVDQEALWRFIAFEAVYGAD